MPHADLEDGLVQGPGRVHFDVGLLDRRHRPEGVHTRHEGKRGTLQVIAAAGADKVHVLRIVEPHLAEYCLQLRHDQLNFIGGTSLGQAIGLAESDYGNLLHRLNPPSR